VLHLETVILTRAIHHYSEPMGLPRNISTRTCAIASACCRIRSTSWSESVSASSANSSRQRAVEIGSCPASRDCRSP
jgi:hypothetical protein